MSLFSLEHSPAAYWLDFALYAGVCALTALVLVWAHPAHTGGVLLLWVVTGWSAWTLLEYVLHRFVLHGIAPFSRWHSEHHQRPRALIASPVVLSGSLFFVLAALPAWWWLGGWDASALTLGLVAGYLVYGLAHHAMHHPIPLWLARSAWMRQRRACHALHHHNHATTRRTLRTGHACHYGVSNSLWDALCGTNAPIRVGRPAP